MDFRISKTIRKTCWLKTKVLQRDYKKIRENKQRRDYINKVRETIQIKPNKKIKMKELQMSCQQPTIERRKYYIRKFRYLGENCDKRDLGYSKLYNTKTKVNRVL